MSGTELTYFFLLGLVPGTVRIFRGRQRIAWIFGATCVACYRDRLLS